MLGTDLTARWTFGSVHPVSNIRKPIDLIVFGPPRAIRWRSLVGTALKVKAHVKHVPLRRRLVTIGPRAVISPRANVSVACMAFVRTNARRNFYKALVRVGLTIALRRRYGSNITI
jgi:hypothetical protein